MKYLFVCLVLVFAHQLQALDNGLGKTPQMGWNSWNRFGCNINETLIRKTAAALAGSPLKAAGYEYVNMDDCWQTARQTDGTIIADPAKFPSGIGALADYVHSLGLKFGLYSDAGSHTCAGRPGSLGYEKIDAQTYAKWGVDYLKYDNCNANTEPEKRYPPMRDALNATGRHIFFSMCEWGVDNPASWAKEVGNSWRTTDDIQDNWISMLTNLDYNSLLTYAAGPGGWNDPDMLEVGNGGMSIVEYQSHFSLWAVSKAPLIIGNDITNMKQEVLDILTSPEVIAVNQDKLGVQAKRILYPAASTAVARTLVLPCDGSVYQKWTINQTDSTIRSSSSGSCLDLPNCAGGNNAIIGVYTCHVGQPNQPCNNQNQQWKFGTDGAIKSVYNGVCATIWGGVGPAIVSGNCPNSPGGNQKWTYNNQTHEFRNTAARDEYTGGCLTVQWFSEQEVYAGPLAGGAVVVALFNRGDASASMTAHWKDVGLSDGASATVRDLWAKKDVGAFTSSFTTTVGSHATVLLKITPK